MGNSAPSALRFRQRRRFRQEYVYHTRAGSRRSTRSLCDCYAIDYDSPQGERRRATAMMREFKFEDEMHTTLACVPMTVRRKLDRVGVKVGLEQWKALGRGERLAICHLPVERHDEREALRLFINEAVRRVCGEE